MFQNQGLWKAISDNGINTQKTTIFGVFRNYYFDQIIQNNMGNDII
jgi:hypothetical protein